jgi:hypothetical protein
MADKLPGKSLLYVGWAGRTMAADGSMMGQMLSEPALAQAVDALWQMACAQAGGPAQRQLLEKAVAAGSIMLSHPAALTVMDFTPGGDDEGAIEAALVVDLGNDKEKFAQALAVVQESLAGEIMYEKGAAGSLNYTFFRDPSGRVTISFGYIGNMFFLTIGADVPKQLAAVEAARSLAGEKRFADAMKTVDGENVQVAWYLDVPGVLAKAQAAASAGAAAASQPSEAGRFAKAFGVADIKAAVGAIRIVERGLYSKTRIISPAPHRGLLKPLAGKPLDRAALAAVPADADLAISINLDAAALYEEFLSVLQQLAPEGKGDVAAGVAQMERQFGVSLKDDVLASLGENWTLASSASWGGFLTGSVLMVDLRDAARFSAAMAKIEAKVAAGPGAPRVTTQPAGKGELHCVMLPNSPVAPAWTVQNNKLYVSLWPQVAQAAAADQPFFKSLATDGEFARIREPIAGNFSGLCYINTPRIIRQFYNWGLVGWTMGAGELRRSGVPASVSWLPALPTLEKYLWPSIETISSDNDGITIEGYGSAPTSLAGPLLPALLAAGAPAAANARGNAQVAASSAYVHAMVKAVILYQGTQNGAPPPDLQALVNENMLPPSMLTSPRRGGGRTAAGHVDYIYEILPKDIDSVGVDESKIVVVYEDPAIAGDRIPVGFLSGNVQVMTAAELERARQEAAREYERARQQRR